MKGRLFHGLTPPLRELPIAGRVGLRERARWEWRLAEGGDPLITLAQFLAQHGLEVDNLADQPSSTLTGPGELVDGQLVGATLLIGAAGAAVAIGAAVGKPSPSPAVPDVAAVVYEGSPIYSRLSQLDSSMLAPNPTLSVGLWVPSWTDDAHGAAIDEVRSAIAKGDVYQVNVVGHTSATYEGDPAPALSAVASLEGARYSGVVGGDGWAVASASPECLVTVESGVARSCPIKGTRPATPAGRQELVQSTKERAEHMMIVDLIRNDLGRIGIPGTVRVERLLSLAQWCDLWQAESVVATRLRPGVGLVELLRALLPGGSVTGAPKLAAIEHIARLESVGRGPAMGALGFLTPHTLTLGLTIRTVAADRERLHVWAGGGITWGSDPVTEIAEAHAKAEPLFRVMEAVSHTRS